MKDLQGVRFFRDSAGHPMLGVRGLPIPLHLGVTDGFGESIAEHLRECFGLAFADGKHAKAAQIREALEVAS